MEYITNDGQKVDERYLMDQVQYHKTAPFRAFFAI